MRKRKKTLQRDSCYTCGEKKEFITGYFDVTVGYEEEELKTPIVERWNVMTCRKCGTIRVLSRLRKQHS